MIGGTMIARSSTLHAILATLLLAACGDECDPATEKTRCEDNVVVYCEAPGIDQVFGAQLRRKRCETGTTCVVGPTGQGACAMSPEPSPHCVGVTNSTCRDPRTLLYCTDGYAISEYPCLDCTVEETHTVCVGGPAWRCEGDVDCAPGLRCKANGYCYR